jgi:uncharacterized damage-inducible protein DinB
MSERMPWLERSFDFALPTAMVPNVLERLRGTPARLEDRVRGVPADVLVARDADRWSIQENIGHLVLVEALWMARLDDFSEGRDVIQAARFERARVDELRFDEAPLQSLLADFRLARGRLVARIEGLDPALHERRALHPRLQQRIRILDLMVFAAEHDDHHLARITELLRLAG